MDRMQTAIDKEITRSEPDASRDWRLACVSEIVALLAHRLAQPMTAINAYAAAGLKAARSPTPDTVKLADNVAKIEQHARRATDMIHAFAAFAHRRELAASPIDVDDAVAAALAPLAAEAKRRGIEFVVETTPGLPRVVADRTTIEQVASCLARNAIDALVRLPAGKRKIEIVKGCAADGMVEVTVADTGPGIAAAVADALFDPFGPGRPEDCGVGLAVSRAMLELYGGRIGIKSSSREGAVVAFALPPAKVGGGSR